MYPRREKGRFAGIQLTQIFIKQPKVGHTCPQLSAECHFKGLHSFGSLEGSILHLPIYPNFVFYMTSKDITLIQNLIAYWYFSFLSQTTNDLKVRIILVSFSVICTLYVICSLVYNTIMTECINYMNELVTEVKYH